MVDCHYPSNGTLALGPSDVEMPYWDKTTQTVLWWLPLPVNTWWMCSADNQGNEVGFLSLMAGWLNKANPDWVKLYDIASATILADQVGTGHGDTALKDHNLVSVSVLDPVPPNIDRWWGSSTIAKYGAFWWNYNNAVMPLQFINLQNCQFHTENLQAAPYGFCLQANVHATFISYKASGLTQSIMFGSTVPPT